jgi:hypothetical protein
MQGDIMHDDAQNKITINSIKGIFPGRYTLQLNLVGPPARVHGAELADGMVVRRI